MTTEPTTEIDPTTWHAVAEETEALAVPGGAVLRVATYSTSGTHLLTSTFVPGVRLEPNGNEYGITARLVAAPPPTIAINGGAIGTPTADFLDAIRRARRARPQAELHITPERGRAGAIADFELHGRDLAHLNVGNYFTVGGNLFRVDSMDDGTPLLNLLGKAPRHVFTTTTGPT